MARKGGPPLAITGSAATERMGFPPRGLWYVASRRWEGQEEAGETGRSPSGCFLLGKTFHDARELWFSILSNPILPKRAKGFSSFFSKSFQCLF